MSINNTLCSMTGYAAVTREFAFGALAVEMRSVNNRYLDLQFRLPEELRAVEPSLREIITARLSRGKVECRVTLTSAPAAAAPELNVALLKQLAQLNTQVIEHLPGAGILRAADVLRWPGVLATETPSSDALRDACRELVTDALTDFVAARAREGARLKEAILAHAASIEECYTTVAPRLPAAMAAAQVKLTARLKEALGSVDDERVRQEIALYAARIDVDEELTRLKSHIAELRRIFVKGGAAGKRLDFLMQELNREANTLGAKAADIEITQVSMDLKLLIEQMREQIQNIE